MAAIGLAASLYGATTDLDHFLQIYLVAFLFISELVVGCLGFLMVHNLIRAGWSFAIQRVLAASARTLPLVAAFFIPILLGLGRLYPWVDDPSKQTAYLNVAFFLIRAVIYFAVWIGLALVLSSWSYRRDNGENGALARNTQQLSALGMILYFVTASLAAFDWSMSLRPDWFSSVYGWLSMSRGALGAFAFAVIAVALLSGRIKHILTERVRVDLGAILLVVLLGWIYLSYVQYLVIWSADIAAKASWYVPRTEGTWGALLVGIALLSLLAFVALVVPGLKRMLWVTAAIALLLLALRVAEMLWVVMPTFAADFSLLWWDVAPLLALGGLWVFGVLWSLNSHKLLPEGEMAATQPAAGAEAAQPQA